MSKIKWNGKSLDYYYDITKQSYEELQTPIDELFNNSENESLLDRIVNFVDKTLKIIDTFEFIY